MPSKVKVVVSYPNKIRTSKKGLYLDVSGYVTSKSQKDKKYHVNVRIRVTPDSRYKIEGFTCECEGFTYGVLCKHVRALVNHILRKVRGVAYATRATHNRP